MPFDVKQIGDDVLAGQVKSVKAKLEKAGEKKPESLVKYLAQLEGEMKARVEKYAKRDAEKVKKPEAPKVEPKPEVKPEQPKPEEKKA